MSLIRQFSQKIKSPSSPQNGIKTIFNKSPVYTKKLLPLCLLFFSLALLMLCAGTPLLTISSYIPSLKKHQNISQIKLNISVEFVSIGVTCMIIGSFIIDFLFCGTFLGSAVALFYGATLLVASFLFDFIVWEQKLPWYFYAMANWAKGNGCVVIYMGALSIAARKFPLNWHGLVIGSLVAMYGGVGAALYSQVVGIFLRLHVDFGYFFLFSAALFSVGLLVSIGFTLFSLILTGVRFSSPISRETLQQKLSFIRKKLFHKQTDESINRAVAGLLSPNNEKVPSFARRASLSARGDIAGVTAGAIDDASTTIRPYSENHALLQSHLKNSIQSSGTFVDDDIDDISVPSASIGSPHNLNTLGKKDHTLREVLASPDLYLIAACFCATASVGIFVSYNVSSMVISLGGHNGDQSNHVTAVAMCNCLGRLIFGFLSDRLAFRLSRGAFILLAVSLSGIAQLYMLFFVTNPGLLLPGVMLSGLAYGCMNSSMPVIVRQKFGQKRFATIMSLIMLGYQLCGGLFIASIIPGAFYEREIVVEHSKYCHGVRCFRNAYLFNSCLSFAGAFLAFLLCLRTRKGKQWL